MKNGKKEYVASKDLIKWEPLPDQSRDQIITWLYSRRDLSLIIKKIAETKYLAEELTSTLFEILCKLPESELIDKYQRKIIDYSILTILKRQFHSSTSTFYKEVKKGEQGMSEEQKDGYIHYQNSEMLSSDESVYLDALEDAIKCLDYKHQNILILYKEEKTFRNISNRTGIPTKYLPGMLNEAKEELKKLIPDIVSYYKDERYIQELFNNLSEDNE